ncbi:Alcohol dehydrogenase GroES-like domain-containing protein [Cladophialophora immunda]|nr:Alcohol dehydrogenase GroES-like domain-containing protein [Cladophialophora immunda]
MGSTEPELAAPRRQKAVVVQDAGPNAKFLIQETDVPSYGDDEVLIRLCYSSICHTDVAFAYGEWGQLGFGMTGGNQTPGHEGVGHVVAVGAKVGDKFKVGDRVGTKWLRRVCGQCDSCRRGDEHLCAERTIYGHASPGSLQQYVASQATTTPRIPDSLPLAKVGPLLCAGVTMFRALKKVDARAGDWIVIAGAGGGLGHLGVQLARKMGLQVVGIDSADKEDFVLFMGAHRFVDFRSAPDIPAEVRRITGGGARGVLVPTGSPSSYEQACKMLGPAGTLVCIGLPAGPFTLPLQLLEIINSGYTVTGVNASRLQDIQDTLDFAAHHQILPMTERLPMDAAGEAFERLKDAKVKGRIVLDLQ